MESDCRATVLADVCRHLGAGDVDAGRATLTSGYPFESIVPTTRRMTERERLNLHYRDGFIDRYSGTRLVNPGVLRLLSVVYPKDFPAHTNWKMSHTHMAFWELFPSVDHMLPVARGGVDDVSNWMTTSMLHNMSKAHWTVDELGWTLQPAGDHHDWDGLSRWFIEYADDHRDHLSDNYIGRWYRATVEIAAAWNAEGRLED